MHPSRSSDTGETGHRLNQRHPTSPLREHRQPPPASTSNHSHTSLPSIRHLHPYLPPSGMSSQAPLPTDGSGYSYHSPTQYSPHSGLHEQPPLHLDAHMSVPQREAENYGGVESEPEGEVDQQGPPKKKRRRQALSCTECKRRKIKCDRSQPCGPCTRRGEQTKCQWHVVEPIEKYVTRAEYDELKRRFDSLEAVVNNLWSASTTTMSIPSYQMGMSSNMTAAPVTVPYPTAQPVSVYQSMMPPSTYPQHMDGSHRYTKTESPQDVSQSPRHQHAMQSGMPPPQTTSPIIQTTHPPNSMGRLRSPPNVKSPTSATKHSPLSLASITSPFNPESQSKNCNAQTLKLGERLRPGSQAHESSAALSNDRAHQEHQQPTRQISISKAQHHSISHKAHHHGATVTLHSSSPVSYHPGMTIGSV